MSEKNISGSEDSAEFSVSPYHRLDTDKIEPQVWPYLIEVKLTIESDAEKKELLNLYREIFDPIDVKSPIAQSYPDEIFLKYLQLEEVEKHLLKYNGQTVGIGMMTSNISLEPVLSHKYFIDKYPNRPLYLVMSIGIREKRSNEIVNHRGFRNFQKLLESMVKSKPENQLTVFVYSQEHNSGIPSLAKLALGKRFKSEKTDAEVCLECQWNGTEEAKEDV